MDQIDITFETLPSIKPYGGRDSNVMFDPLGIYNIKAIFCAPKCRCRRMADSAAPAKSYVKLTVNVNLFMAEDGGITAQIGSSA